MEPGASDQPKRHGQVTMDIKRLFALRPKGETSADLRITLRNAEGELQQVSELLASLEASQGEVLLTGSSEAIEAQEAQIREAQRARTSLAAMIAALGPRINVAEAREASATLDQAATDAQAKARAAGQLLPEIFATMERLANLVERHDGDIAGIRELNKALNAGGRARVPLPLSQFWPRPQAAGSMGEGGYALTFADNLVLVGPRGACRSIKAWRAEMERAQILPETDQAAD